jgi:hypothetical protein
MFERFQPLLMHPSHWVGGVQFLLLVPVAATLRLTSLRLSWLIAIAGVAGFAGVGVTAELYVLGLVGSEVWYPIAAAGCVLIGIWVGTISLIGRSGYLPGGLTSRGVATGVGIVMIPIGVFLLGSRGALTDPRLALHNYPFLASIAIGIIATVIGVPIWSIWRGCHFLPQAA